MRVSLLLPTYEKMHERNERSAMCMVSVHLSWVSTDSTGVLYGLIRSKMLLYQNVSRQTTVVIRTNCNVSIAAPSTAKYIHGFAANWTWVVISIPLLPDGVPKIDAELQNSLSIT